MDKKRATEILEDHIRSDGELLSLSPPHINYDSGSDTALLEGYFSIEQLEAIIWWMRNK